MQDYLKNLEWRYATKKFDTTKKLSQEQINFLEEAARLAPSSFGIQPWKFYIVSNPEVREEMKKASWGQAQVTDSSHIFVVASRIGLTDKDVNDFAEDISKTRGVSMEAGAQYQQMMISSMNAKRDAGTLDDWCARQAYIALGFILSAAAQNGIDACPMEGFDNAAIDKILGITEDGYASRAYCAVGFRAADDDYAKEKKVRFPKERIIKEVK